MSILVVAEHREAKVRDVTLEILWKAKEMAHETGVGVAVAALGDGIDDVVDELASHGPLDVIAVQDPRLASYTSDGYLHVLGELAQLRHPTLFLLGHTAQGMDLAPALATRLDAPLVTDCTDLSLRDGVLTATRRMYSGKASVRVVCERAASYVATVSPTVFPPAERGVQEGRVIPAETGLRDEHIRVRSLGFETPAEEDVDIAKADVVVAAGRGLGSPDNMAIVEDLAEAMGGVVAGSRPVIDMGWLPKSRQVGQSGKTVRPRLYVAVGISGAIQHVVGMNKSDTIVAISKDHRAPIFRVAHYGVVGDASSIVPQLTERLKSVMNQGHQAAH